MSDEFDQVKAIYEQVVSFFIEYSFQLIGALIVLIIGLAISNRVARLVTRTCEKHQLDVTLSRFLASCTRLMIIAVVAIICLNQIGISITPFVAAIGALSLGAGLAVQGLLSNYGAGLNIILTRPFVVGDTITVQGVTGVVDEVRLAQTILTDEDNVTIMIPNRHIVGEIIHNSRHLKLVESRFGVSYTSDPAQVEAIIRSTLKRIGADAEAKPHVGIEELGESALVFLVRYWVATTQYHQQRLAITHALYSALREARIEIPFPQREVRMLEKTGVEV